MIGSESIDVSLGNIWRAWLAFKKGKKLSRDLHEFQYKLEENLLELHHDLVYGRYQHGGYRTFMVRDNKRREVSVSIIRDRIVHRLIYDYLTCIYDKTFIYDAWSCRKGKGLIAAIGRAQDFLKSYPHAYIWRADVRKFFDSVDQEVLLRILSRRVRDPFAYRLLNEVIVSFAFNTHTHTHTHTRRGMPIGNLTSQIFANIYLNELDRFVKHTLRPLRYLRYGDDFIVVAHKREELEEFRCKVVYFLRDVLKLQLHVKNNIIIKARHGLQFLGVIIWPNGRKLNDRSQARIRTRMNIRNIASYRGLLLKHFPKKAKEFSWRTVGIFLLS